MTPIALSVVAPVYNEAAGIERVVRYWVSVLAREGLRDSEIVLANDGSTDGTDAVLEGLQREFPTLRVVTTRPNHGYGFALGQAIAASRGALVVTLDSDGQFDLADVTSLLALYRAKGARFRHGIPGEEERLAAPRGRRSGG